MASGEWGKGSWLDSSNKTPPLPTTRATIVRFGLTRRLGFVGDDATDEVRLSAAQGRHQVIQLFLFRFQARPDILPVKNPPEKMFVFSTPKGFRNRRGEKTENGDGQGWRGKKKKNGKEKTRQLVDISLKLGRG